MSSKPTGKAQPPPQSIIKFGVTTKNKTGNHKTTRQRSKFDPTRRQQVKSVRKKRACLRCSLLRIKCSDHDICATCKQLIVYNHEKQTLSFSGCIRTRLPEVSVFEFYIPSPSDLDLVLEQAKAIASTTISLDFASHVVWDLRALTEDTVEWLNDSVNSDTSKVGTFSSPRFLDLIGPWVDEGTRRDFQQMIYAVTLAYTQTSAPTTHHLNPLELYRIGAVAGHNMLKVLDEKLKPQSLKSCTEDHLQALFLLVVGTILAVGYAEPDAGAISLNVSTTGILPTSQFLAMQNHLCQILAHYVVYLGSQLTFPIRKTAEPVIIQAAAQRWNKEARFWWNPSPADASASMRPEFDRLRFLACTGSCSTAEPSWSSTHTTAEFRNTAPTIDHEPMLGVPIPAFTSQSVLCLPAPSEMESSALDWHDRPISPFFRPDSPFHHFHRRLKGDAKQNLHQLAQNYDHILPSSLPEINDCEALIPDYAFHNSENSPLITTSPSSSKFSSPGHYCDSCGARFSRLCKLKRHELCQHSATKSECPHSEYILKRHLVMREDGAGELDSQAQLEYFQADGSIEYVKHVRFSPSDHRALV